MYYGLSEKKKKTLLLVIQLHIMSPGIYAEPCLTSDTNQ